MKTWFITGIFRGLGKALAQAALARGDTVVGTVREAAPDTEVGHGTLHVLTVDLTDAAAIAPAVSAAFDKVGHIDVLVNNAGYGLLGAIEEATDAEFQRLFAVNVFAPFAIIRAALPAMRRQGSGHILNITSIAGRAPAGSSGLYSATKSALEGLTQSPPTKSRLLVSRPRPSHPVPFVPTFSAVIRSAAVRAASNMPKASGPESHGLTRWPGARSAIRTRRLRRSSNWSTRTIRRCICCLGATRCDVRETSSTW